MNGEEFKRRARRYARRNGLELRFDPDHGKGSHGALYLGSLRTFVPDGEIRKGTLSSILKDLGIDPRRF